MSEGKTMSPEERARAVVNDNNPWVVPEQYRDTFLVMRSWVQEHIEGLIADAIRAAEQAVHAAVEAKDQRIADLLKHIDWLMATIKDNAASFEADVEALRRENDLLQQHQRDCNYIKKLSSSEAQFAIEADCNCKAHGGPA